LIQIKRQAKTSNSICIRNGAIRRVIDRERDEAATRRRNHDKSKQAMAFMYAKSRASGQQMMPSGPARIAASVAFPQSASAAGARLIYVNA
jgi:hypothetical protein